VLSITAGVGFVNQAEKFGKEIAGAQYQNYTVLHKGDFSYNKGNSKTYPQGCIYMLEDRTKAAVPNVFNSFSLYNRCSYILL
jgi:type I restriction enzyme S subunit